ncbi:hypothetical protein [Nonomuraea sp. NPDC048826]|uniref:hypothetical protein n=1 Tax=Nonomuraea sp. NPDC048826 TaxID=3364347 RepID=UPI003717B273
MPALLPPTETVRDSFLAAVREFHAHPQPVPWFVADLDPDRLAIRHRLTPQLEDLGGHIGGRYLDRRGRKVRFLIPTAAPGHDLLP